VAVVLVFPEVPPICISRETQLVPSTLHSKVTVADQVPESCTAARE
jgi:hypothetical protein